MSRPLFLSVDWDFFPRPPQPEDRYETNRGTAIGALLADWGHGEAGTLGQLRDWAWTDRAAHFEWLGLDLTEIFRVDPERDCIPVDVFLGLAADSISGPVWWSDSHTFAYMAAMRLAQRHGPLEAWHFDAHHDLGYRKEGIEQMRESGNVTCEDWLLAAIDNDFVERATVVYPPWRGLEEWQETRREPWIGGLPVTATTWPRWADGRGIPDAVGCFIARSGSWCPPYLDPEFWRLACGLAQRTGQRAPAPLPDVDPQTGGRLSVDIRTAMPPIREWDPEAVHAAALQKAEAIEQLEASRG